MNKLVANFRQQIQAMAAAIMSVLLIAVLDYYSGNDISTALFYVLPVTIVAIKIGRTTALVMALLVTFTWVLANISAGQTYSHWGVWVWNGISRFGFFSLIGVLLADLQAAKISAQKMAMTDTLTGAYNSRYFYERLNVFIKEMRDANTAMAAAYFDLDNFKQVNDTLGHTEGDRLLREVVRVLTSGVREGDVLARLGGDEFALLMPEASSQGLKERIEKLAQLVTLDLKKESWPVTLSAGLVLFLSPPETAEEAVKVADNLMYEAKHGGKNQLVFLEKK